MRAIIHSPSFRCRPRPCRRISVRSLLTTSTQTPGLYTLTVNGVEDLAANVIAPNTTETIDVSPPRITIAFQNGVSPLTTYAGMDDATLSEQQPDLNAGSDTVLTVDGDHPGGTDLDFSTLMRWDISTIPAGANILAARIEIDVSNVSPHLYSLYQLRRDWQEAEATWNQPADGQAWSVPGAMGTADRGSTVLGRTVVNQTGIRTMHLNEAGVTLLQDWVDGTQPNHGFILADALHLK